MYKGKPTNGLEFYNLLLNSDEFTSALGKVTMASGRLEAEIIMHFNKAGVVGEFENATLGRLIKIGRNKNIFDNNLVMALEMISKQRNYLTHNIYALFSDAIEETILEKNNLLDSDVVTYLDKVYQLYENLIGMADVIKKGVNLNRELEESIKAADYKIWFPHEVFYIESLFAITTTAMSEKEVTLSILDQISQGNVQNKLLILDSVQNIITQAAMLSKFLWPVSGDVIHKLRGQKLREVYSISHENILKNRNVRNFIEHFDEKLDIYLQTFIAGTITPVYVGNYMELKPTHTIFRAYYTDTANFEIMGQKFFLIPIMDEIQRLHRILEIEIKTDRFTG